MRQPRRKEAVGNSQSVQGLFGAEASFLRITGITTAITADKATFSAAQTNGDSLAAFIPVNIESLEKITGVTPIETTQKSRPQF